MGKTFVQDHCKRPDQMAGDYTEKNLYKKKLKKKRIYKKGEGVGQLIPLFKFRRSDQKKKGTGRILLQRARSGELRRTMGFACH